MSIELRPYQRKALDDLYGWFGRNPQGNPVVSACVGAGKSILLATLCREAIEQWPGTRIVMAVASRELCEQNLGKLFNIWPDAPASVYSASLGQKTLGGDVLYATIGSIYRRAHELGRVDLLLVDECHLISGTETGMYRTLIADLRKYNPDLRVIGWTGTAFRGNGVWLTDQEEPIFHGIAASVTMRQLLDDGYLAPLRSGATATRIDTSGVEVVAGDFKIEQLAEASDQTAIVEAACDEILMAAADRRRWLVFGVTIAHATHIAEALTARGVRCAVVSSQTPAGERGALIRMYRAGQLRALVNVGVLTTGFDVPEVDCIALLRPTRSPVLYIQIAGRGMRVAAGKTDCLWLDFSDTTATLGPVDQVSGRPRSKRTKGGDAPTKLCEACGSINAAGASVCSSCGQAFPVDEKPTHGAKASDAAVLSGGTSASIEYPISRVGYARHTKPGSPDSLRVDYYSGIRRVVSEWVCLFHSSYAAHKAAHWWGRRHTVFPTTIDDALAMSSELAVPTKVIVNDSGRYPEVIGYVFADR